jgi:hypothetical protein
MTNSVRNRSHLMLGCGSAALAMALVMAPQAAHAQAINGSGSVVQGSAVITDSVPGETTIDVASPTAVIDWTPTEDAAGNALDFLPTNTTARFQSGQLTDFAVLNRILPSTNGNIVVINGSVLSRVTDAASGASVPGGFVAFYSPTGILIGSTATFDVGRLLLTTLDPDLQSFQNFASFGGNLSLTGAAGSTARIQINPGAQILATPENSFFAVVAADVQMLGTARINGSHAYVAGEVVNLSFSNGLFNISVPVGTSASGNVMQLDGDIGGPSSNGAGDNHMIYALAAAQADPISMIFRGNLGFDPAQSAGIVNGEIILSANHNVFGRSVDGGSIDQGINAVFGANSATSTVRADIFMEDFAASSSVLAISSHRTQVTAFNAASSVAGNLLMVGRENAELTASNGQTFTITGDVLVSAQDYGVVSSSLQNLDLINAAGGIAFIDAFGGGTMNIGGNVLVAADAFAGAEDLSGIAGTAQGGDALIGSTGGTLNITGDATVSARGVGTTVTNIQTGATVRGGLAQFFAIQGGQVTLDGNLVVRADAIGAQGSQFSPSTRSDAFGGDAFINVFNGGGTISIGGDALASASAFGGSSNSAGSGSIGDAGQAIANINGGGQITITGALQVEADGVGGDNAGGTGGLGLGGRASSAIFAGGTIGIGLDFDANADGLGGNGQTGGDGFGGIAGANAVIGTINIGGSAFVRSAGLGGGAFFGFGGNGGLGRGGNGFLQANGTLTDAATLTVAGDATVFAQGVGGDGGQSDGQAIAAGRGGDGYGGVFTIPNQADPAFNSGAFILAGGDNGTLSVGGNATALATGFGGSGGGGGSALTGGEGGDGFGGLAQVGLALLGQNGSLGQGSLSANLLRAESNGFGGTGGFSFGDFPTGNGGDGNGGNAFLTVRAGDVTAFDVTLDAYGYGAQGAQGGLGTGGIAAALGSLGGTLTTDFLFVRALGIGGDGGFDTAFPASGGGDGIGGNAELDASGITVQINSDLLIFANGQGGNAGDTLAGNGVGGLARLGTLGTVPGSVTVTGNTLLSANGFGGGIENGTGGLSGDGTGGTASLQALAGGTVRLATVQVMANGFGGEGQIFGYVGGDGTGGNSDITATGAGSQIIIERNVTQAQANGDNFGAILSANGVGRDATAGAGIGGTGRGGTATVSAQQGGRVTLPATPLTDPNSVGFIRLFARGFGGNSAIDGGTGGTSFGGNANIDVNGGAISMGETVLSSFTQAGTGQGNGINVTGGNAFAGSRSVRITNGGTSVLNLIGGAAGAQGGAGTGTGNGGNAYIGQNVFLIDNASSNIIGPMAIFDQSAGGNGQQGGSVFNVNPLTGVAGSLNLTLNGATITFTPDASGTAGIGVDFVTRGGDGVVRGGNAQGPIVNVSFNTAVLLGGGFLTINPVIQGGNASALDGIGGDALGSLVSIAISNSQLNLSGETVFAADANGGEGGVIGTGGSATSGTLDATFTNSTINIAANAQGAPGVLRLRSQAIGGVGGQIGSATSNRAQLNLVGSTLTANSLYVESRALGNTTASGQIGGTALSRDARISMSGVSGITAGLIEINSFASSSQGGSATAGIANLQAGSGATATVTAPQINLLADASSLANDTAGIAGATQGGQALVSADGGNLTITGNVLANARGLGATSANLLSGATARGGVAQLFARLGGSVTLNGNINLDASATGSTGSLVNGSTVSDAFGGLAVINVGASSGTITINGDARADASAFGGTSNNAGVGSLGDAGEAVATLNGVGLITVTGRLTLEAEGAGGDNAGGIGGTARGGRASVFVPTGGTINLGSLDADTVAVGGNGLTGGDAFGGIAGAVATIGNINIQGWAFAGTEGVGGNASYGFGGTGGVGRGGNSAFQATGTLTQTARVFIGGDAIAFAQGVGGRGGVGNLATGAPAGRGGDGFGGQFTVPNQADPNFNNGAFILAGGDNGSITVVGEAVAVATGAGGTGGTGGGVSAGGRGGDAFGGLAQVGLALLGQNGSLGLGTATFGDVLAQSDAFGGNGGTASGVQGNGGNATGGDALMTVRAGDITANQIELSSIGFGGRGALGGFGFGGAAAAFGSLGGTVTATRFTARAEGFGGNSLGVGANGGEGRGGGAEVDYQDITFTINGDAFLIANGTGGTTFSGIGGNGTGGLAQIGVLGAITGSGTITGTAVVHANGTGGGLDSSSTASATGGDGFGGTAAIRVQAGGLARFGAAQVLANGTGASSPAFSPAGFVGGNGDGGDAEISSTGAGSRVIIERNITQTFANSGFNNPFLGSVGTGGNTSGGTGIGGSGQGGTILIAASAGGSVALPATPLTDPGSVGLVRLVARGIGGGSSAEGGIGGQGRGGSGTMEVDGGTLTMGAAVFSVFGQGGSSLDTSRNIAGGQGVGGNRLIRVFNSGTASVELVGGTSGGVGGNASGTGDGGDAFAGRNRIELTNGTLNVTGNLLVIDQTTGGNGNNGGDAFGAGEGGGLSLVATDSVITMVPNAAGETGISMGGTTQGGNGATSGGDAFGAPMNLTLTNTTVTGGRFELNSFALGGNASATGGIGGNGSATSALVQITGSTLNLAGQTTVAADAQGGNGSANGGNANAGPVSVLLNASTLNLAASANGSPGILRLRSLARAGNGTVTGTATSRQVLLDLASTSRLAADEIYVETSANADAGTGGAADSDIARIRANFSVIEADLIQISANAVTGTGGNSVAGWADLQTGSSTVTAGTLVMAANASGADPARQANVAGLVTVVNSGGNINLGSMSASAFGDVVDGDIDPMLISTSGGNINVSGSLEAQTDGDIVIRTRSGGIIGGPRAASTTARVQIASEGTIRIEGDSNTAVGLGGDVVSLSAREIEITDGARIGADEVFLNSLDRGNTAVLGGSTQGTGFTLTAAEIGRIATRELSITVPNFTASNAPDQPDLLIRDLSVTGSGNNGVAVMRIFAGSDTADGIIRVEGTLSYTNAGATDLLDIEARRLEVVTPGGIRMEGANNAPSGELEITARDVWVADADTIAQLQADRFFVGRDDLLSAAAVGSDDPLGYIRAGGVTLRLRDSLMVRNTGVEFEGGGILVGDGGLSIIGTAAAGRADNQGQTALNGELDVTAYGRRQAADGSFVLGADFFAEVNFNRVAPGTTLYLDASNFNDCNINNGECPQASLPEELPPEIFNPTVIDGPLMSGEQPPLTSEEEEERFGMDFPEQPDAPLISEDPLLDDPVSSGGDASLYSGGTTPGPRGEEK